MALVAEGVEWLFIYFVKGASPKYWKHKYAITDPPNAGWGLAFVLRGEKRSTIFSPYSLEGYTVPNSCGELDSAEEPKHAFRPDYIRSMMEQKWKQFQSWGWQRDYDTCALVMRRFGWEVPAQIMTGGEEDNRKKGGKETGSRLLKPVKENGKRGRFLKWFLEGDGSRSVREAMAEFSMTRSNALSYLYMLQKDHGIGYELVGDIATVALPDGCTDPFNEAPGHGEYAGEGTIGGTAEERRPAAAPEEEEPLDDDDDSWLD